MEICTGILAGDGNPQAGNIACSIETQQSGKRQQKAIKTTREFFAFAPEIRNIIYHRLLGGQHIHVYADRRRDPVTASVNGKKGLHSAGIHLYSCTIHDHDPKREWLDEHLPCFIDGPLGLPGLALLRTCRQIHQEAALIPYAANTFIFMAPPSFETFVTTTLTRRQARALRSLALWSPIAPANIIDKELSWKHWRMPPSIQSNNLLVGLQSLILNFSIFDETSLSHIDGLGGIMILGRVVGKGLRKIEVKMTWDETSRRKEEVAINTDNIASYVRNITALMLRR